MADETKWTVNSILFHYFLTFAFNFDKILLTNLLLLAPEMRQWKYK